MGSNWQVWAWRWPGYEYELVYQGCWWWRAVWAAVRAKRTSGCVKVEWRG